MKRILSAVVCISIISAAIPTLADNNKKYGVSELFDAYSTNQIPTKGAFSETDVYVTDMEGKNNKALCMPMSSGASSVNYTFSPYNSKLTASFEILVKDNDVKGGVSLLDTNGTSMKLLEYDNYLYTYDGKEIGGLRSQNKFVECAVTYDPSDRTYNVYVNGKCVLDEWLVDKSSVSSVASFEISFSAPIGSDSKVLIDNIFVYEGEREAKHAVKASYNASSVEREEAELSSSNMLFESDFNSESDLRLLTLLPFDNEITVKKDINDNGYLSVTRKSSDKSFRFVVPFSGGEPYVVVEADICGTGMAARLFGSRHEAVGTPNYVVTVSDDGKLSAGGKTVGALSKRVYTNIAVCANYADMTYSVYVDKKLVVENKKFTQNMTGYGNYIYFFFDVTTKLGTIGFDNIAIYKGTSPKDKPATNNGSDVSNTDRLYSKYIGTTSPFIDLRTDSLSGLDQFSVLSINGQTMYNESGKHDLDADAFIVDGRTYVSPSTAGGLLGFDMVGDAEDFEGVIERDGEKYIPIADYARQKHGKFVTWNELGLVFFGNTEFKASDQEMLDINSYMLYDRPAYSEIKERLDSKDDIKLLFTDERISKIKNRYSDPALNDLCERLIKEANTKMKTTCENYTTTYFDRKKVLSQDAVERIPTVLLAYYITGDEKYADYVKSEALYICTDIPDWDAGTHGLTTAHLSATVAIAYNRLYEKFTPEEREILEEALYTRAVIPMFGSYHITSGRDDVGLDNNRTMIISGGIALAALAVYKKYPAICADVITNTIINHEAPLLTTYPSGIWYEGVGYTGYTFNNTLLFLDGLISAFGTDFNLTKTPGFNKLVSSTIALFGPTGCVNYGDCQVALNFRAAWLYWYAGALSQPEAAAERQRQLKETTVSWLDVLFYMPSSEYDNYAESGDAYLKKDEIAILRDEEPGNKGVFAVLKSGYTHTSHGHLDSGEFIIDMMGERFASDLGKGDYSWSGYSSLDPEHKYQYYVANAEGHNTLVINPGTGYQQNIGNGTFNNVFDGFEKFVSKEKGSFAITQLSNAYADNAKSVRRGIMLADEKQSVVVRDEIELKKNNSEIYWFMHVMNGEVKIVDKNTAYITVNGKKAKLSLLTNASEYELSEAAAAPLPMSLAPLSNQTIDSSYRNVIIKLHASGKVNITVKLQPAESAYDIAPISDTPLDKWDVPEGEQLKYKTAPDAVYINGEKLESYDPNVFRYNIDSKSAITVTADVADYLDYKTDGSTITVYNKKTPEDVLTYEFINNMELYTGNVNGLKRYHISKTECSDQQVTASANNSAEKAFDDDFTTRWAANGEQWLTADLGTEKVIDVVGVSTWKGDTRDLSFRILVSADNENWTEVFRGITKPENGEGYNYVDMGGVKARYVKLYGYGTNQGTWNSILEFAVLGKE